MRNLTPNQYCAFGTKYNYIQLLPAKENDTLGLPTDIQRALVVGNQILLTDHLANWLKYFLILLSV